MLVLSGERVSDLDRIDSLRPGDELLISRHYNLSSDRLFSKRLKYETLVGAAVSNLCAALNLSSAAFEEKCDYSRKNHGHDYSSVYVYTRYPSAGEPATQQIAAFEVRNGGHTSTVNIFAPYQVYDEVQEVPRIGELKFMALGKLKSVDVMSDEFDGWVYPDGSEYSAEDFPDAWFVYRSSAESATFKVPVLSSFFRLNPGMKKSGAIQQEAGNVTAIPAHKHNIQSDIGASQCGNVEVQINIPATDTCPEEDYKKPLDFLETIHLGENPGEKDVESSEYRIENVKQSELKVSGGMCRATSVEQQTFPTHNMLPVMVYIGLRASMRKEI